MLVLSRHMNEIVDVTMPDGTRVEIVVVDIRGGDKVRLAFSAPPEVVIHRREITEAIAREKEVAAV